MSEPVVFQARLRGRDATHRTRNLDTHLTHGCMQLFRHFWRQRSGTALRSSHKSGAFLPCFEAAHWHRTEREAEKQSGVPAALLGGVR